MDGSKNDNQLPDWGWWTVVDPLHRDYCRSSVSLHNLLQARDEPQGPFTVLQIVMLHLELRGSVGNPWLNKRGGNAMFFDFSVI